MDGEHYTNRNLELILNLFERPVDGLYRQLPGGFRTSSPITTQMTARLDGDILCITVAGKIFKGEASSARHHESDGGHFISADASQVLRVDGFSIFFTPTPHF